MAIIKCKMCGGDLNITDESVAVCEYCGTQQTVPSADNEKKLTLFGRANRLRLANEFDKAAGVYESIVAEFPDEAEAYWGLVLCRYGIEYVDDPATGKKIPTCHRSSFESVLEDSDFEQACENADAVARKVYREEAKAIEALRRDILEVSGKEEPYDIFICYKETDDKGERTIDSVIAQDVYDALTEKGYRVFFSRISLEDKLGTAYEPYIFAALNSAKIMLAFGTDYEYLNAVWVKNEWSRFLALIAAGQKKTLIPCYKGIDAYDMPKEFAKLQAQDMGKVGAIQDLLRGIDKVLETGKKATFKKEEVVVQGNGSNVQALLKRGYMALEDGEWEKAEGFFEQVLNLDAECAEAYLGLSMSGARCSTRDSYATYYIASYEKEPYKNIKRAKQYAGEELQAWFKPLEQKRTELREEKKREEEKKKSKAEERRKERVSVITPRRKMLEPLKGLVVASSGVVVALKADGTVVAVGDNKYGQCNVSGWCNIVSVIATSDHIIGLKSDGTVVAVGNNRCGECNVSGWRDIVSVAGGGGHTVGLKSDGTVVAVGNNSDGKCDVSEWRDIVSVAAGMDHTVGVKSDGTVVAVGDKEYSSQCDVCEWRNIASVVARRHCTGGLKSDGTVVAAGAHGQYALHNAKRGSKQCDVSNWRDIVSVVAGDEYIIGLKSDGTVAFMGTIWYRDANWDLKERECAVADWKDIVSVVSGRDHIIGLKMDGTVVAAGINDKGQCNVEDWKDIVFVAAGDKYTIGVKSDGRVVAVGDNKDGCCNVSGWKLFNRFDMIAQEREDAKAAVEAKRRQKIAILEAEQQTLKAELLDLKGLFSGKRRREIEDRLAGIERELNRLNN